MADGRTIRVGVVDDHAMVAAGIAAALRQEPDVELLWVAGTVAEAARHTMCEPPDVVLMDFRLPDGDGAAGAATLRRLSPDTQVVIITATPDKDVLARAIAAGCAGFLDKSKGIDEVVMAVRAAAAGEALFSPAVLAQLVDRIPTRGRDPTLLTAREVEVLNLLAQGASTDAMVEKLVLSRHTVRNHVRNILFKLGAHSKLEAVAIAAREEIVSLEDGR